MVGQFVKIETAIENMFGVITLGQDVPLVGRFRDCVIGAADPL